MRVSVRWLQEYVDIPWAPEELAERLTDAGAKVEAVHTLGEALSGVVVGRIEAVRPHPSRGETLAVCTIDVGGETLQTVTGAPNARVGLWVPVALPGAVLPGLDGPVRAAEVGGVESACVLCSERELGLSDDHSGLMELPEGLSAGADFVTAMGLDDTILEFEIYPNRPDCLSVIGIAREVAAITGAPLRLPASEVAEEDGRTVAEWTRVDVQAPELCPRYLARVITGVRIAPSPPWMQERLRAVGMRPINNVVDVTNYCMMELGQPLHAFDYDRLDGGRIVVRRAHEGERITTLDGKEHQLDQEMLLICDASRPVALAGIMGGLDSEVTDETTTILLESATFDPVSVRKTAKRLGIRTESSYRFERDLGPHLSAWAVERAARLLAELSGGKVAQGRIDVCEPIAEAAPIVLRVQRVNDALGTRLEQAEMERILTHLGFRVEPGAEAHSFTVHVPPHRRDVEGEADIVEEIARIYGYDRIPATLPTGASVQGRLSEPLDTLELLRDELAAAGCFESITYSFISPKLLQRLGLPADDRRLVTIPLANPLSDEHSVMRTMILPSLLEATALNQRRRVEDVRLFEIGSVYMADSLPLAELPEERKMLAIVMTGEASGEHWSQSARPIDFYDLKGVIEEIGHALRLPLRFVAAAEAPFHPGRAAMVLLGDIPAGYFGEIHPDVAAAFGMKGRIYGAELDLEILTAPASSAHGSASESEMRYRPIPRFPSIQRDLALLVPEGVAAGAVLETIERHGGPFLRHVHLFDVYEGDQVPEGFRSLAYAMTYQASDRTLTDDEVEKAQEAIRAALAAELGVHART